MMIPANDATRGLRLGIPTTCSLLIVLAVLFYTDTAGAITFAYRGNVVKGSHANTAALPQGCRTCHQGMNMMTSGEEGGCLRCHGTAWRREQAVSQGLLRPLGSVRLYDMERELSKRFRHPTLDQQGVHRKFELLPEEKPDAPRHAECGDCHRAHLVAPGASFAGIRGRKAGSLISEIQYEYELCYLCHSVSANLPSNSTDKAAEFRTSNRSYHPVEAEGKNPRVISLVYPYAPTKVQSQDISQISCGDCHGSDDISGPDGPHGSEFRGLLRRNYQQNDGWPENDFAYDLCYGCHDRRSILNNESFPYHSNHIVGDPMSGKPGTSCMTCHDAHGSPDYRYLIRFNEEFVFPNADGKLAFEEKGVYAQSGSCFLNCHGIEHNPKSY